MSRFLQRCCLLCHSHYPYRSLAVRITRLSTASSTADGSGLRYRPRRALLYVPGNDAKKILKISSLDVDCAVLDCEDGVALTKKNEARDVICQMLGEVDFGRSERCVRINSIDSGMADDDVKAVFGARCRPQAIVIPKVESVDQVDWIADRLKRVGQSSSPRSDSFLRLIVMIEGARAFLDLDKICRRAKETFKGTQIALDALIFGSDDFCASIGATRTKKSLEILYARQHFVIVAKAYHLQPIDMVYIDYKDHEGFREQCLEGAQMGFNGKQVIHPSQIPIAQKAFLPSPEKIEWAIEVIDAFEEHQKSGKGAFTFEGSMIDMPTLLQAKNLVQLKQNIDAGK